ncbi:hypothetical protein COW36_18220 [bacterium (Candidatus Blackallbacteria) CG17_big_fil_post_rev_8_21_14_2_50_48_46]|uniref:F0F1 ATP synthase subunit n=1 Tax=bacterium (Candidatus Blackallbacteria) CG17_big_fil_post_rev_8_21_14_2_50_48_46 TaxID=2014261 RepID=A0A2M7G101_9BACT|nr:MAG: hypothetical protein COW64_00515 [bacterium (Candidatus Blackallbacteria) CG18_big_fil_WC_8_21_14_2_50_49_26]PIW15352.1 MAG: hypothetical protein COW36_18220 [bacterium (Candidatus Blackallbacteria) CG17_big_fil_post_rev_8_21_14_2_50_48_46]PIW49787.1 MAG: hypothetical protein COW20_05145 [bacterium (Candidatus Blackallbacteria) CG13_big_fil_rev_8_21_14_2_50_49_14]
MNPFEEEVKFKLKQRQKPQSHHLWVALSLIGSVGWLFILPTVGGAYLGWWLDGQYRHGQHSWTLTCLLLGLGAGVYLLYRQVYLPSLKAEPDQKKDRDSDGL